MKIKEAAERLDLHRNTLIQYEELGLHKPDREPGNNYRIYEKADLEWIQCLREMIQDDGYDRKTLARMLELNDCWDIRECTSAEMKSCRWARKLKQINPN